jgi:hypothetical protein
VLPASSVRPNFQRNYYCTVTAPSIIRLLALHSLSFFDVFCWLKFSCRRGVFKQPPGPRNHLVVRLISIVKNKNRLSSIPFGLFGLITVQSVLAGAFLLFLSLIFLQPSACASRGLRLSFNCSWDDRPPTSTSQAVTTIIVERSQLEILSSSSDIASSFVNSSRKASQAAQALKQRSMHMTTALILYSNCDNL